MSRDRRRQTTRGRGAWSCGETEESGEKQNQTWILTDNQVKERKSAPTKRCKGGNPRELGRTLISGEVSIGRLPDHRGPVGTRKRDKTDPPSLPSLRSILSGNPVSVAERNRSGTLFFLFGPRDEEAFCFWPQGDVQACTDLRTNSIDWNSLS